MTYAEFIEAAVEQFARHGIDVDSRVRAVINNLAMVVGEESLPDVTPAMSLRTAEIVARANARFQATFPQGDGSMVRSCMRCEVGCSCDFGGLVQREVGR